VSNSPESPGTEKSSSLISSQLVVALFRTQNNFSEKLLDTKLVANYFTINVKIGFEVSLAQKTKNRMFSLICGH
jgi:hypothetical protein